jgi:hypothetical protein
LDEQTDGDCLSGEQESILPSQDAAGPLGLSPADDVHFCGRVNAVELITVHRECIPAENHGWILSVHKNSQVAVALIATETAKSEISVTVIVGGPFPVSKRNIHGRRIMA